MASIYMDNALKRCTTCSSHDEPITLSEELPCPRVTAFSLTSLFLELFRREFRKSFKFLLMTLNALMEGAAVHFRGKKCH